MTIKDQTIKYFEKREGVDLKTATDEEIVNLMEYYKLNGTAELYKQLSSYKQKGQTGDIQEEKNSRL